MRRAAGAALMLGVGFAVLPAGPAVAGPAPDLCAYDAARGGVPAAFALEACVDGTSVTLRNQHGFPVAADVRGAAAPAWVRQAAGPRSAVLRLVFDAEVVLMPGDVVRWPLGAGPAEVSVATAEPGTAPAVVRSLDAILPRQGTAEARSRTYSAVAELVRDLVPVLQERTSCAADQNVWRTAACDVAAAADISGSVKRRIGPSQLDDVLSVALDPERWARWADSRPPDLETTSRSRTVLALDALPGAFGEPPLRGAAVGLGSPGPWAVSIARICQAALSAAASAAAHAAAPPAPPPPAPQAAAPPPPPPAPAPAPGPPPPPPPPPAQAPRPAPAPPAPAQPDTGPPPQASRPGQSGGGTGSQDRPAEPRSQPAPEQQPDEPGERDEPAKRDQPEKPGKPGNPGKPGKPGNPGNPEQHNGPGPGRAPGKK